LGLPTGTVTLTIDGVAQPSVVLSNGQAAFTTSTLSVGSHRIAVTYSGDANFDANTSARLSQAVNQADTAITFGSSAQPSVFGQPVTFTATVGSEVQTSDLQSRADPVCGH